MEVVVVSTQSIYNIEFFNDVDALLCDLLMELDLASRQLCSQTPPLRTRESNPMFESMSNHEII